MFRETYKAFVNKMVGRCLNSDGVVLFSCTKVNAGLIATRATLFFVEDEVFFAEK